MFYCVISWDIGAREPIWSQINTKMFDCIKGYKNVRPVNTFYLVKLANGDQRTQIINCLEKVKKDASVDVYYVVSPLYKAEGGWAGEVKDTAELIKVITNK